ncbi:MAG: two-component sensor histidine kinase [Rhodobacteraceae bacterium]|nr:two-component sensor histidine kinase [Paracoccaceae bacterium]
MQVIRRHSRGRVLRQTHPLKLVKKVLSVYSSILNAVPIPLVLIGADERIVALNEGAERLFGGGLQTRHYITALRQPSLLDCIENVHSGRSASATAPYLATERSRETSYQVSVSQVALAEERAILLSFVDTTDLQEAGQMRRDFVANVSHELRTPLTALIGFIETLRGAARDDPAARDRFLGIMEKEAGRMNRLVRDLLSLSRVEAQERVRPETSVNLTGILASVLSSLRPFADEAGVEIVKMTPDTDVIVPGDADQLTQVFYNLVENAIKYSGKDSRVTLELVQTEHEPVVRGAAATVTVGDTGEGIDPVHIPRLTERFYRVDTHRSRDMGGTGLGLAIVKHIVNRHRGRLRVHSTPGKGSQFSVVLPVA